MFTFFNSDTLWIGTNMRIFNQIRDELAAKGIVLKDTREGTKWSRA